MKATWQYFLVVLVIVLHKVVLTFEYVDEILKCDHSNESCLFSNVWQSEMSVRFFQLGVNCCDESVSIESEQLRSSSFKVHSTESCSLKKTANVNVCV